MIGNALVGVQTRLQAVLSAILMVGLPVLTGQPAAAADCPGNPDALGTSRTLVVDPRAHSKIGTMQYAETLPLRDHEVVLTFDDGPLPRNSNQVLAILAAQCIKATFFTIGQMAHVYPENVRKLRDAGHTIGTHSQNHPLTMNKMPPDRIKSEVDDGIASVKAALGADADQSLAPFFRIPGLMRAEPVEDYLGSLGIQTWSADFLADDWRHISSQRVYDLAIQRLEAKGKGILLLHDIQARTVAALPRILAFMKAHGYQIVQVVPATPDRPATPTEPQDWQMHPTSENVAISHWPKVPNFIYANAGTLVPATLSDFEGADATILLQPEPFDRVSRHMRGVPLPREAPWPREWLLPASSSATALPVPAPTVFEIPELPSPTVEAVARLAPSAPVVVAEHEAAQESAAADADESPRHGRHVRGKHAAAHHGHGSAHGRSRSASKSMSKSASRTASRSKPASHGSSRHLAQIKKKRKA
jgi:peptidoglycan-N-acetylglucosamine deacetylase